ncbi:MAG: hypothetical protein GF400_00750, partial [Candidatus Eisenbacteria bacterium]|nr:hypothetical protein [Candidatus Eisenbacteria bacterium]
MEAVLGGAVVLLALVALLDGIVFLASAPRFSLVILVLALTVLGPAYAMTRIAASLVVALAAGYVVLAFLERRPGFTTEPSGAQAGGGSTASSP